jgi:23S rRNA pseudouridine1911/1915/1917 synthase
MGEPLHVVLPEGGRLDKALAAAVPPDAGLSRSRLRGLIEAGAVAGPGGTVTDPGARVKSGEAWRVDLPAPVPAAPLAQAIPLAIVHEDADLIVVDKPAGMVVHPAPGAPDGTLVNALLAHCGDSLSGIGGERRPGIVHRIDKDTSGLLVAAKTDRAHQGLSALFAAHDIERAYLAVVRGVPDRASARLMGLPGVSADGPWIRIEAPIARHRTDRKRMAVVQGGRRAVTRLRVVEAFAGAALVECRLETGRTHQIRVHMAHVGHPIIGDPVYGRGGATAFPRQALHAAVLGFVHPVTGATLRFESPLPPDMGHLLVSFRRN